MSWRASGLKAWAWQRLSAVYLAIYISALLLWLLAHGPFDHAQWSAAFGSLKLLLPSALALFLLLVHAWVGARDVILDYLHPAPVRFAALGGLILFLLLMGLWALFIFSRILQ